MESFTIKYPVIDLATQRWLNDHQWAGRPVLPAAKMLHDMADATRQCLPHVNCRHMRAARFGKFFFLDDSAVSNAASFSIKPVGSDGAVVSLGSRRRLSSTGMTRQIEHGQVVFGKRCDPVQTQRMELVGDLWTQINTADIYPHRIAFGPAFHTICSPLHVCRHGCIVNAQARRQIGAQHRDLGSLFVLDAAWHGACIWAQEYGAATALPVGFEQRRLLAPTRPQERYDCHVRVHSDAGPELCFDIAVVDSGDQIRESVTGMRMRVVSVYPGRGASTS